MTDPNNKHDGNPPLGQSISDIVDRTTTIVHEEIELAKAELAMSLQNLLRGSVAGIVGGIFAFFGLFVLLIGISLLISDLIDFGLWPGFLIVALLLFAFGAFLAMIALKKIKKGSHLIPEQAIAEAKATQAALQTELDQEIDSVAVEETSATADVPVVTPPPATKPAPAQKTAAASSAESAKVAEAADLLAAAKDVVEKPAEPPAPTFVTERTDVPFGEADKASKAAAKADTKAAKQAAKAQAKADKEAAKAQAESEKDAAKAMKAAEKEAAEAQKAVDKALKKAGKSKSADEKSGDQSDPGGES